MPQPTALAAYWAARKGKAAPSNSMMQPAPKAAPAAKGITDTASLKAALKAYSSAPDKKAAKASIIAAAKSLGATNLLPASWGVKADTMTPGDGMDPAMMASMMPPANMKMGP